MSRQPMTGIEATDIIDEMRRHTNTNAQRGLIVHALRIGNLGDAARQVYAARLEELEAKP